MSARDRSELVRRSAALVQESVRQRRAVGMKARRWMVSLDGRGEDVLLDDDGNREERGGENEGEAVEFDGG
jgi:hypothetical protein